MAWIEARNMTVLETVGRVNMDFMITRGDRSVITRAFAVTRSVSATEGKRVSSSKFINSDNVFSNLHVPNDTRNYVMLTCF